MSEVSNQHKQRARPQSYTHASRESPREERQGAAAVEPTGDKHHHRHQQGPEHQGHGPVRRQQAGEGLDFDSATTGETWKRRDGKEKPVPRPR